MDELGEFRRAWQEASFLDSKHEASLPYIKALEAELAKAREANKDQTNEVIRACRAEAELAKAREEVKQLRHVVAMKFLHATEDIVDGIETTDDGDHADD